MYETILPISEVKNHLRIDDDFTEDDNALKRMVASALQFIEQKTNHIFLQSQKTYSRNCNSGYIDIFDHPITYTGELTKLDYAGKTRFDADSVEVTVGYGSRLAIPSALIDCALMIIENWYYGSEKQANTQTIPDAAQQIINTYRRFTAL